MTESERDPLAGAFAALRTEVREHVPGPGSDQLRQLGNRRARHGRYQAAAGMLSLVLAASAAFWYWPGGQSDADRAGRASSMPAVDWKAVSVPLASCPGGVARPSSGPLGYGDIDADGRTDAVLPVSCGSTQPLMAVRVAADGQVAGLGQLDPGPAVRYNSVAVEGHRLRVGIDPGDPLGLSPTQQRVYEFHNGQFSQVTRYQGTADANNTTLSLPGSAACAGGDLTFASGVATTATARYEIRSIHGIAEFADLDGDGMSEMLTPVTCVPAGRSSGETALFLLHLSDTGLGFSLLATPHGWDSAGLRGWTLKNPNLTLLYAGAEKQLAWDQARHTFIPRAR
ncbi:hypothetical protein [Longispora albida]|uniref:hypothetical protein n=1 Tax=Longispora albida TaxID=203523 RepID=UPI00037F75E7|nr:hypothetical protein [Longispora albida]